MTAPRPVALIRLELETALDYQRRYETRSTDSPWTMRMRDDNERELSALQVELAQALSADVELSLSGTPVDAHRIAVPYLNRVLEALQASYRAVLKSLATDKLHRADVTLAIAGTAPGSFTVMLTTPAGQLELMDDPLIDRGMLVIVDLLADAEAGTIADTGPTWAARADQPEVRAMIRFSAALASSKGTTHLRWRSVNGDERTVTVTAEAARSLAMALAGESGREVLTVIGHLEMAQDRPPKVRVRTGDDDYVASIPNTEMLDRVKELLFDEVVATLVIDTRTSSATGSPDVDVELLDLDPA